MAMRIRQQYPGVKFREGKGSVDRSGRFVCQLCYCPYPNKRVWKTIRLDKKSYREAAKIRTQWISEYVSVHPQLDFA